MNKIMTADEFVEKLLLAAKSKTVYATGGWGACAGISNNREKYANRCPSNAKEILNSTDDTFFFDCVCLVKGVLWGWNGDTTKKYGGAVYASNGVPDWSIPTITSKCSTYSTDFTNITKGEWLNLGTGHCGIYIGDGLAVESTPIWEDGAQITAVKNISTKAGYNSRRWDGHGKLPCIEYNEEPENVLVVDGWWGKNTTYYTQKMFGTVTDGIISSQPLSNKKYLPNINETSWKFKSKNYTGSDCIYELQTLLIDCGLYHDKHDRCCGKNTVKALQQFLTDIGYYNSTIDGYMGYYTVRAWQQYVNDYFHKLEISQ